MRISRVNVYRSIDYFQRNEIGYVCVTRNQMATSAQFVDNMLYTLEFSSRHRAMKVVGRKASFGCHVARLTGDMVTDDCRGVISGVFFDDVSVDE
jgi:hypothetical protein